jgi:hypothetical protein
MYYFMALQVPIFFLSLFFVFTSSTANSRPTSFCTVVQMVCPRETLSLWPIYSSSINAKLKEKCYKFRSHRHLLLLLLQNPIETIQVENIQSILWKKTKTENIKHPSEPLNWHWTLDVIFRMLDNKFICPFGQWPRDRSFRNSDVAVEI